jgi:hypothetical protein
MRESSLAKRDKLQNILLYPSDENMTPEKNSSVLP